MAPRDYREYEPRYREHYEKTYRDTGRSYEEYESAYRYGYEMGGRPEHRGKTWDEVESLARRGWDEENKNPWHEANSATHFAWDLAQKGLEEAT